MHEEIKNRKKISEILTPLEFEKLKGMLLLFNRDSEFFKYSGWVTASLLDYENPSMTILAIKNPDGWITHRLERERLTKMLESLDAVCGDTPDDSFLIEK